MRPLNVPPPGQRHNVDNDAPLTGFGLPRSPQMTYFLADESTIGSTAPLPGHNHHRCPHPLQSRSKENNSAGCSCAPKVQPRAESSEAIGNMVRGGSNGSNSSSRLDLDKNKEKYENSCAAGSSRSQTEMSAATSSTLEDDDATPLPPYLQSPIISHNNSTPGTPVMLAKSGPPSSALSSVSSSRRNSFAGSLPDSLHLLDTTVPPSLNGDHDDDGQTGENNGPERVVDDKDNTTSLPTSMMMDSGSVPQLIMPSIKMPSRRPFTDEGKAMGRLKVMIAGDTGVGKTSLIKAIVQSCEHIVHVDPIGPSMASSGLMTRSRQRTSGGGRSGRLSRSSSELVGTSQITEIYASTKPYPEWWSEIDDFKVLRRRKSLGDTVLDRNICFVDTPGYASFSSNMDTITPVARYVETNLHRMSTNALADGDMLNLLGGEGGVQVDVVFYMVSNKLRPVDLVYLRELAPLTNIILLLAQADLMIPEQIAATKEQILGQLNEADIRLFSFAMLTPASITTTGLSTESTPGKSGVYAISTAAGSDHDIMDASLLMSPDYVEPLQSSELSVLVEQVFSQNGAAWLRHAAARKYVQWRKSGAELSKPYPSPRVSLSPARTNLSHLDSPSYGLSRLPSEFSLSSRNNQILTPAMGATSSYALARIADHTQREERLAQVRLANWAAELQKSLAKERAEIETIARGERAIWLAEKLNECVQDGTLVPASGRNQSSSRRNGTDVWRSSTHTSSRRRRPGGERVSSSSSATSTSSASQTGAEHQDPLGLLQVAADLRYKSIVALEVLGSLGVLGGLALWISRQLFQFQGVERVAGEWERFCGW
ncbi:hypothetical protein V8F06_004698 [Rhypophila decipiens]